MSLLLSPPPLPSPLLPQPIIKQFARLLPLLKQPPRTTQSFQLNPHSSPPPIRLQQNSRSGGGRLFSQRQPVFFPVSSTTRLSSVIISPSFFHAFLPQGLPSPSPPPLPSAAFAAPALLHPFDGLSVFFFQSAVHLHPFSVPPPSVLPLHSSSCLHLRLHLPLLCSFFFRGNCASSWQWQARGSRFPRLQLVPLNVWPSPPLLPISLYACMRKLQDKLIACLFSYEFHAHFGAFLLYFLSSAAFCIFPHFSFYQYLALSFPHANYSICIRVWIKLLGNN